MTGWRVSMLPGVAAGNSIGSVGLLMVASLWVGMSQVSAQELEPRAYASSPVDLSAFLWVYSYSKGSVLFDPTLPVEDVTAAVNVTGAGYFASFAFLGRMANASAVVPYTWGSMEGLLNGGFAQITRSGLADARFRFTTNLIGAPAMTPREFAGYRQKTNLGVGVTVSVPTGQYDSFKLINLGTNRWAVKPELGISHSSGRWLLEAAGGFWFFGRDEKFLGGLVRTQRPVGSVQGDVVYHLPKHMWVSFNANFYKGGQARVEGVKSGLALHSSRYGLTFSIPLKRRHSVKVSYSDGVFSRAGTDFRNLAIAYQFVFRR